MELWDGDEILPVVALQNALVAGAEKSFLPVPVTDRWYAGKLSNKPTGLPALHLQPASTTGTKKEGLNAKVSS